MCDRSQVDRGVLGKNGNAALFFLVVGVHQALGVRVIPLEGCQIGAKAYHQRGLPRSNVGNMAMLRIFLDYRTSDLEPQSSDGWDRDGGYKIKKYCSRQARTGHGICLQAARKMAGC